MSGTLYGSQVWADYFGDTVDIDYGNFGDNDCDDVDYHDHNDDGDDNDEEDEGNADAYRS